MKCVASGVDAFDMCCWLSTHEAMHVVAMRGLVHRPAASRTMLACTEKLMSSRQSGSAYVSPASFFSCYCGAASPLVLK